MLEGPSRRHWLGTDENGCDLLVQLCYGARLLLGLCSSVVGLCLSLGLLIGVSAGYLGGWFDEVVMRVIDVLLAFPGILLNIAIVALVPKAGVGVLIFALAVNGWVGYARVARAQVLRVREQEYVLAARSVGCSPWRVMLRHILPNIWSPIIVQATFGFAGVVLVEASLSFLGLGPPVPYTWGALLAQGTNFFWRTRQMVSHGALLSVDWSPEAVGQSLAMQVNQILDDPNHFEVNRDHPATAPDVTINRQAARRLGIRVDPALGPGWRVLE